MLIFNLLVAAVDDILDRISDTLCNMDHICDDWWDDDDSSLY